MTGRSVTAGSLLRESRHVIAVLRVLVLVGLSMLGLAHTPAHPHLYWLLTTVYGLSIVGYLWVRRGEPETSALKGFGFLFDVGIVSALILLRGNDPSEFLTAYFALVLMAAIAQGLGNAFTNAALVSIAYAVLRYWGQPVETLLSFGVITHFAFFFVIAVFMGHLAQEAREEARERDRAKAALKVTSSELKQSTAKLKAARESLRANDRLATLGMLSAGIAHEMKNPLAAIASSLEPSGEILDDLRADLGGGATEALEELESILDDCKVACQQLLHVASDLTSLARGRSGDIVAVDPRETVDCVQRMLRGRLRDGAALHAVVTTPRRVLANPGRLLQVLLNLVGNALDAVETAGKGEVTIRAEAAGPENVALIVEDTGPGMSETVRRRVFDPFFTTKPTGRGTGLGLHVVREIVTAQRGSIDFETRLGEGTTFRVELPAQPVQTNTERPDVRGQEDAADRRRRGDHPSGVDQDVPSGAVQAPARL